jgi:hypothetical protein
VGVNGRGEAGDVGAVAAVLRLADLAGQIERVDGAARSRIDELARDCAEARERFDALCGSVGDLAGRADEVEERLAEVSVLLGRMAGEISALMPSGNVGADEPAGYRVHPGAPWWKAGDPRCEEAGGRLADWVQDVFRPVFGYLADLLAPCWRRHPLCLVYLDVLHEAWCLLYLNERDPKMVFAQLDWLNRSLLQAAEVMANETKRCRDLGRHREARQDAGPFAGAAERYARR